MSATLGRREDLTFKANLQATRYGWLRLTPAYSVHLVAELLERHAREDTLVLDPYCGTGTTALVCAERGVACRTTDINPFLVWLTRAKTAAYDSGALDAFDAAAARVAEAIRAGDRVPEWLPRLHRIDRWGDEPTLHALGRAMAAIREQDVAPAAGDLLRIAFCRVLIDRASVSFGHQSMSFATRVAGEAPLPAAGLVGLTADAWTAATRALERSAATPVRGRPAVTLADARELGGALRRGRARRGLTSPPYPNRMSYIRELRPYMYWLGYLSDGRAAGELDWQAIGGTWGCATSNVAKWTAPAPRPVPYDGFEQILARIAARSDLLS